LRCLIFTYRNLKKGNISTTELICINDALLVKVKTSATFMAQQLNALQNGFIHLMTWS
jgi:hypothetical protein